MLFLFVVLMSTSVAAQPDIVMDGTRDNWPVGTHMFLMEDASRTLTIEDVSRGEFAHQFTRSSTATPTYGYSRSVCWVRFSYLQKDLTPDQKWLLALGDPTLERVDIYFQNPDGSFDVRHAGAHVPLVQREIASRFPAFLLREASTAPVTVYLRLETSLLMRIPLVIMTNERLIQEAALSLIPWWIYIGFLASMALYSTFLYFFLKDGAYLYYTLYVVFNGTGIGLSFSVVGYEYFPDGALWLERLSPMLLHLGIFVGSLFVRSVLNTRRMVPRIDRLMLVLVAVSGVFAVLAAFIPARLSQLMVNVLAQALAPLLLVVSVVIWRRGFRPARFVLAGWSVLGVSFALTPFYTHGLLPTNIITHHLLMIGSTIEMILFALALASRINEAERASELAKRQALEGEIHRLRNIELRQANEEILRKQGQLVHAEKMASLGELTAGVAHEIKNPLNFVNNFSLSLVELTDDLLQELTRLPANQKAVLEALAVDCGLTARKIAEHGERANGIVRSMLDHASIRPGERRMTDINQLVEEHIQLAHSAWSQRSGSPVSIRRDLEPGLSLVEVIPQELGRVLLNLLNNAFHAVDEQCKKGLNGYDPFVRVSTHGQDGRVRILIQDNGAGVPAELREKIFKPFFTTKPPGQGIGLGLSLSYGIITKRHSGTLDFESIENEGTTFVIALPIHPPSAPHA
ncbi:7TM diverse intracellular signaling domain-containing protein [Cystobacter fuscus]|uniref:sensor histidine kinase n=1 Tax=Cystobacter fuscus TaxID=43 RepID=UPI000BB3A49F|nr:7TM diverse intracellular signaling domain-containing protein [Cystobacter fuscus]